MRWVWESVKPGREKAATSVGGGIVGSEDGIVGMGFDMWASIF